MNYQKIKEFLSAKKNILITTHKSPDGDAIGSSLGLKQVLDKLGHNVSVVVPNQYPDFLKWMKGNSEVVVFDENKEKAAQLANDSDVIFCLDFNTLSRINGFANDVSKSNAVKVLIDHHQQPDEFDFMLSDTSASSTAQLVYDFIVGIEKQDLLDSSIGECLYTGIMTDTGSFRFPSTSAHTHRVVASLMDKGLESSKIHNLIFDTNKESRMKLLGYVLNEKMQYFTEYKTVIMSFSQKELDSFDYEKGDTEGFVNYGLSIEGVRFAAMIKEYDGEVKLSLRSKGDFSVNALARKYFNGGGHNNAAGGKSDYSLEDTVQKLISLLPEYKNDLINS